MRLSPDQGGVSCKVLTACRGWVYLDFFRKKVFGTTRVGLFLELEVPSTFWVGLYIKIRVPAIVFVGLFYKKR